MKRFGSFLVLVAMLGGSLLGAALTRSSEAAASTTYTNFMPVVVGQSRGELPLSIFGVQVYYNSGPTSPYYSQQYLSGASWIRIPIQWSNSEPSDTSPADFSWSYNDAAVRAAQEGFTVIGTIGGVPDWAGPYPEGVIPGAALADFAEFLGAVAERYDGDGVSDAPNSPVVNYYEMFNEPDASAMSSTDVRWGNYGAEYATMLSVAYGAIKAANPNAKVLFGGMAHDWFEPSGPFVESFLIDALAAGACPHFDYMNFHLYPAFASNWADYGPGLIEKAADIRGEVVTYCGSAKPMVITETGWHSNATPGYPDTTPETQAHYVVQLGAQSLAADINTMVWWLLWDIGFPYPFDTGLVNLTGEQKPAFRAYQGLVAELGTAQFVRTLPVSETGSPDLEVHQFSDPVRGRTVYVAWVNPINTTTVRTLSIPASLLTKRTIYGATTILKDGDDGLVNGRVTLVVGGAPVYLEIEQ